MNDFKLSGRLAKDVVIRKGDNWVVGYFTLAVDMGPKKDGTRRTEFIDCKAWGKLAESIAAYNHKGDSIIVDGKIDKETVKDQNGAERKELRLIVNSYVQGVRRTSQPQPIPAIQPNAQHPAQTPAYQPQPAPVQQTAPVQNYQEPTGYVDDYDPSYSEYEYDGSY